MRNIGSLPLFLVAVLAGLATGLPSPYAVITPGGTWEIAPRLRIPEDRRQEAGRMAFTAVYQRDASWGDLAAAYVSREAEVVPVEQVRPRGVSQEQVNEANRRAIDESKPVAAVVALRAAGYDVAIRGQGAEVLTTVQGAPADGILQAGDVVVAIDGSPIETANQLVEAVRRRQVGDILRLDVKRGEERLTLQVGTRNSPTENGVPQVGVSINTVGFDVRLPFPVDIDSESVGGPSAGMMFALGIYDGVTRGDLTRGNFVAGTGSINQEGVVGPVGGVAEKVIAAERAGAQVFLVPRANLEDAQKRARKIPVVPIDRFDDAVRAVCTLAPRGDAPTSVPEGCG